MDERAMTPAQRDLWARVHELWRLVGGDEAAIRAALHPRYVGWAVDDELPHDREAGVRSAASSAAVTDLRLEPLSVEVYDETGVVHYRYRAALASDAGEPTQVAGRWTEVYVRELSEWLLVAVSGGSDVSSGEAR